MPRARWLRRGTTDSPRPAGRRWAGRRGARQRWAGRLRRGGSFARRVLLVRHRPTVTETYLRSASAPVAKSVASAPAPQDAPAPDKAVATAPVATAQPLPSALPHPETRPWPDTGPVTLLPGDRTAARQLGFLVVNLCTLASLSLGILAVLLAMRGEVQTAATCLIGCVVLDGMDGILARRLGVASAFGTQLDSLADMCAFGVAAPVVLYASVVGSVPTAGAALACALVAACAAVRLARFNVSPKDHRYFTGVPTTLAAAVLAVAVLVELPLSPTVLLLGAAGLAFAMVSTFPYATLARLLRLPPWLWLAPLAGFLLDARLTFVCLVGAYLVSGPALWLHRRRAIGLRDAAA